MRKRIASPDAPFQRAETVARMTGIPISHIRNGVKDGSIPCMWFGTTIICNCIIGVGSIPCMWFGKTCLVNVPAYLRQLGVTEELKREG